MLLFQKYYRGDCKAALWRDRRNKLHKIALASQLAAAIYTIFPLPQLWQGSFAIFYKNYQLSYHIIT